MTTRLRSSRSSHSPFRARPLSPPSATSDGKLAAVGRSDGVIYTFLPSSDARVTRHLGWGPNVISSRVMSANFHFFYACQDFAYLDQVPVSTKLHGSPSADISYANGRLFVSTNKDGGLYAFELT